MPRKEETKAEEMMAEDFGLLAIAEVTASKVGSLRIKIEGHEGPMEDGTYWVRKASVINWESIQAELKMVNALDENDAMAARPKDSWVDAVLTDTIIIKRFWCEENGLINDEDC